MSPSAVSSALDAMTAGSELGFSLNDIAFDELLLQLHMARFTGTVTVGSTPAADRIFLREGATVGVRPRPEIDQKLLGEAIVGLKLATDDQIPKRSVDGLALGQELVARGIIDESELDRVVEEQARRRLFALYDLVAEAVHIAEGLETLAHFHAVYVDVRPVIAFGMVVRSSAARKSAMRARVQNKVVRLVAAYDGSRNGYGLPPPVLLALDDLATGIALNGEMTLPGLSKSETAGVLLLFDRMSLLKIE